MTHDTDTKDLELYLAAHAPAEPKRLLEDGAVVDGWRVTALLGKGGSGEVYRIERVAADISPGRVRIQAATFAALKILVRDSDTARDRFAREVELLSQNSHSALPRYFGSGDFCPASCEGRRPYYVMELLEPVELPQGDHAVAAYLLAVVHAVEALHRAGQVHRDIKPQNVMRRANGEIVLIDLGLVRPVSGHSGAPGLTVTVENGHAVGAGTPRYAAPEQFNGGAVSPATDIHALGMLANECFGGRPPRAWERIISRSTSSIPERRYADIAAFTKAIRRRHGGRIVIGFAVCILAMVGVVAMMVALGRATSMRSPQMVDARSVQMKRGDATDIALPPTGHTIATDVQTNIVERRVLYEKFATNDFGAVMMTEQAWRNVTNTVAGTVWRLNEQTYKFDEPVFLESNRYYWIVGPGILDASIEGHPGSRLCLDNCILINRTVKPLRQCGIQYIFRKGADLKFINQERNDDYRSYIEDFDGAYNTLKFRTSNQLLGVPDGRNATDPSSGRCSKEPIHHREAKSCSEPIHYPAAKSCKEAGPAMDEDF